MAFLLINKEKKGEGKYCENILSRELGLTWKEMKISFAGRSVLCRGRLQCHLLAKWHSYLPGFPFFEVLHGNPTEILYSDKKVSK